MNVKESPWLWFGGLFAVCVLFLLWSSYQRDPEDVKWNDADIPPPQAALALQVPGNLSPETTPMGVSDPMRHRKYPVSLFEASASVIGTF